MKAFTTVSIRSGGNSANWSREKNWKIIKKQLQRDLWVSKYLSSRQSGKFRCFCRCSVVHERQPHCSRGPGRRVRRRQRQNCIRYRSIRSATDACPASSSSQPHMSLHSCRRSECTNDGWWRTVSGRKMLQQAWHLEHPTRCVEQSETLLEKSEKSERKTKKVEWISHKLTASTTRVDCSMEEHSCGLFIEATNRARVLWSLWTVKVRSTESKAMAGHNFHALNASRTDERERERRYQVRYARASVVKNV